MSKDRRILGLPRTAGQKQTERFEDELMQKVAGETPEVAAAAAPPPVASPPPTDDVPAFDETTPYAVVRGIAPGVEYVQGRNYFNRGKQFVCEAPMERWYFSEVTVKKVSDMDRAEEARAELRRKGLWEDVPRLPKALLDAEKENARAAAAEQNAA